MTEAKSKSSILGAPPAPQRGRPREFDRSKAVHTAMELFWKSGYMQTTLIDLCEAMKITPPSFYCAFETKENLFLEVVEHYKNIYWNNVLERFINEKDIYAALYNFLMDAVRIYLRPNLPSGCFIDISTVGLSPKEERINHVLARSDKFTNELFRKRLMMAIDAGQIPPDSDIPAIAGALFAFLKGVATMARQGLCQSELMSIAGRGMLLLPPMQNR